MKKLLILFFSLIAFSFSFSKADYLEGIDIVKIKEILIKENFEFKSGEYEDLNFYFFERKKGKFQQKVDIYFTNGKPFELQINSYHFHRKPEQLIMKQYLDLVTEKIGEGIENEVIKRQMAEMLREMPDIAQEVRPGKIKDIEKNIRHFETKDYYIKTSNMESEKSIAISCDQ